MVNTPGLALAFAAGFISSVSPCCLPLVPGYLAAVSGTSSLEADLPDRRRVMLRSAVFVGTFSLVFILLGLGAAAIGSALFRNRSTLETVAGVAIVAMGVLFIASVFFLGLNREWRPRGLVEPAGRGSPVVAGLAFSIAWTPCVGPTLGAILGLAATGTGTVEGALLLNIEAQRFLGALGSTSSRTSSVNIPAGGIVRCMAPARGYTASKEQLLNRLARVEGQVRGVRNMVEEDRYCIDVLTQINAAQAALDRVALGLLDDHARHCMLGEGDGPKDTDAQVEELMGAVGRMLQR